MLNPSDWTRYEIPNPAYGTYDAASGPTIPLYNLDPAKRGLVRNVDKNSENNRRLYNGYDIGFTMRIGGGQVYGGTTLGRQQTVTCDVENPNSQRFCDQRELDIPYQQQFKVAGSYPLPWKLQLSGSWQGYPGAVNSTARQDAVYDPAVNRVVDWSINGNYNVTSAIFRNSTGLALTNVAETVPVMTPGQMFLNRWNQVDLRFARKFQVQRVSFQAQFDIFNALNGSNILAVNETFGTAFNRPTAILQGRLLAFGMQLNF